MTGLRRAALKAVVIPVVNGAPTRSLSDPIGWCASDNILRWLIVRGSPMIL